MIMYYTYTYPYMPRLTSNNFKFRASRLPRVQDITSPGYVRFACDASKAASRVRQASAAASRGS